MSVADNYSVIVTSSTDAEIRVDIPWEYDDISELYIWQQDADTGEVKYLSDGDFTVVEKSDGTGDYIEVENVSTTTAIVNTARESDKAQTYELANSQALDPVALIKALDKAIKNIQEMFAITGTPDRQVITSVNPFDIPDKVSRAGKLLSFDENGDVQFTTSDEALDTAIGYAEEWANKPEDQLVSAGAGGDQVDDYSALHHSAKASEQRVLAETAESNAQTSESNASTSASNALASENKAQLWAEEDEDVEVETGQFSAKHWAKKSEDAYPAGTIIAYPADGVVTGWLDCDGSILSRTTYAELFAKIGGAYGGDGSTTFKVPDYRGVHLRCVSGASTRDPDKDSRTDRGDGTTGNNVGTFQGDQFASHNHNIESYRSNGGGLQNLIGRATDTDGLYTGATNNNGGSETRPKNIYVRYLIKY